MAQEELEIEIDAEGGVTIRTVGIKGERCLDQTARFAQILDGTKSYRLTSEFYANEQAKPPRIYLRPRP